MIDQDLVARVRQGLAERADDTRAVGMQAYMKSSMPCRGVPRPEVRNVCADVFREHRLPDRSGWEATIHELWDHAAFREERYAATMLAGHRSYRSLQSAETLPLYEHLITTGAWWDHVDDVSHHVGAVLRNDRARATPPIRSWRRHPVFWMRRSAIICQLGHKSETDPGLLTACTESNLGDPEFFVRKAIGWALREYARSEPEWVRVFVLAHQTDMSPLSRREATKHL